MFLFEEELPRVGMTPQAMQMQPPVAPALNIPQPQRRPSLLERILPMPSAFGGLLTDEDMRAARARGLIGFGASLLGDSGPRPVGAGPSFGEALGRGVQAGYGAFDSAVQGAAQQRVFGQQHAQTQRMHEVRKQIAAQFPATPNETSEQTIERMEKVFAALVAAGDTEAAGKIGEVLKSYGGNRANTTRSPQEIRTGNEVILRDPVTGREVARYPIKPSPKDPNAPDTAQQMRDQRMFQREQQLTDDFNKDTKAQRESAVKLQGAISEVPRAQQGDGAAQINILYAFVTAMDPQSAVREGEIALARAAAPFWQQAQQLLTKYTSGESVTIPPALIGKMGDLMQRRLGGYERYVEERADYYTRRASKWKLDTKDLFPLISAPRAAAVPAAPSASPLKARFGAPPK